MKTIARKNTVAICSNGMVSKDGTVEKINPKERVKFNPAIRYLTTLKERRDKLMAELFEIEQIMDSIKNYAEISPITYKMKEEKG